MSTIKLAVHGAAGRMGRRVVACALGNEAFELIAGIENESHPLLGQDCGALAGTDVCDVALSSDWPAKCDVVIDFSLPTAVDDVIDECTKRTIPLVIATTGLSQASIDKIHASAKQIPIVFAPSMSPAVNLTMKLAQQATKALKNVPGGVDIEIIERHHRFKADAPSGTALKFGELIAEQMDGDVEHVHGREGETGQRTRDEIGYHAVRVGDNTGQHTIVYGMMGETLELHVGSSNRDSYSNGSLVAAQWLRDKPAGLYSMFDVLDLN